MPRLVSPGLLAALALCGLASPGRAADLFTDDVATLIRTERVVVEPFVGYLRGTAHEYVYANTNGNPKLSQLDWLADAFAVGGRVAVRPLDWLTIRARGWATVASDGVLDDYDWMGGYFGPQSWTHWSHSPRTDLATSWQADGSLAFKYYGEDDLALTVIAGYRYLTSKWNASGGSFIYSVNAFRDTLGAFAPGQIGIAYKQTWQTPYLGLGATYTDDTWSLSAEVIGSPLVMADDRDYHALRQTLFKEKYGLSSMVGAAAGIEYRMSPVLSLAGRVEYQKYFESQGDTYVANAATGTVAAFPKPSAGTDADTLLVSLGVKARL